MNNNFSLTFLVARMNGILSYFQKLSPFLHQNSSVVALAIDDENNWHVIPPHLNENDRLFPKVTVLAILPTVICQRPQDRLYQVLVLCTL